MSNIPCGAPNCPMTFTRACSRSQHVKACVYAKLSAQRKSAALRDIFAPPTMRAPQPMWAIHEERVETWTQYCHIYLIETPRLARFKTSNLTPVLPSIQASDLLQAIIEAKWGFSARATRTSGRQINLCSAMRHSVRRCACLWRTRRKQMSYKTSVFLGSYIFLYLEKSCLILLYLELFCLVGVWFGGLIRGLNCLLIRGLTKYLSLGGLKRYQKAGLRPLRRVLGSYKTRLNKTPLRPPPSYCGVRVILSGDMGSAKPSELGS